jgi:hypothetical protein
LEERYRIQAEGYDLDKLTLRVSSELDIDPKGYGDTAKTGPRLNPELYCDTGLEQVGVQCHRLIKEAWCLTAGGEYCGQAG